MTDSISIEVNGRAYQGWKSAQVVSGLDQIATQFALSITEPYPGSDNIRIRPGDAVVVKIGSDVVATGYVDKTPIEYNAKAITHSVSGRSKTADLADCCVETGIETEVKTTKSVTSSTGSSRYAGIKYQANGNKVSSSPTTVATTVKASSWKNIDIEKTIATLIEPYSIRLKTAGVAGVTQGKVSVSVGATVAEAIKNLIKKRGLWATDDAYGDLVLWTSSIGLMADDAISARKDGNTNVLSGSAQFDYESVYTDYVVFGQSGTDKKSKTPKVNIVSDKQSSTALGNRHRTLKLFQSGDVTKEIVNERADFENSYRLAKTKTVRYTVQGWRQSSGILWQKGMLVYVSDDLLGIDEQMVVSKVTFDLTSAGSITTLEVAPADAFRIAQGDGWGSTKSNQAPKGATKQEASR